MTINLYLVRHGQTLFNKEHRMQGSCDSALTPLGIKQIEATRDYLRKMASALIGHIVLRRSVLAIRLKLSLVLRWNMIA